MTLPRSRRKRSLSIFSPARASHSRQPSGVNFVSQHERTAGDRTPDGRTRACSRRGRCRRRRRAASAPRLTRCVRSFISRDLGDRRPAEHADVIVVDEWIVQRVALQEEFENRLRQLRALGDAVALGHRSGADVAAPRIRPGSSSSPSPAIRARSSSRTKCVATPAAASFSITYALIRLFVSPFRSSLASFTPSNAGDVVAVMHDEERRIVGRVDRFRFSPVELLPLSIAVLRVAADSAL